MYVELPTALQAVDLFVDVDGARLRYRDEGSGPAVLLVHGWTLDLEMWNPQVAALRDNFRLIRFDRRGHGLSSGTATPQGDAADCAALCTHLRLAQVALVAMSQGVRAALGFACAAPDRVSALVLDGPPALDPSAAEASRARYAALLRAHGIERFRREWLRDPLMQLRSSQPRARALLAAMIARYSGNDLRHPHAARQLAAERRPLESILVPTLVLSGQFDLPERTHAAAELARRLSDAELVIVSDAGHLANLDNPDAYSELCRGFLSRHVGGRAFS